LYESEMRSNLSYQRAIATIKAYPNPLKSATQLKGLPFIGEKISSLNSSILGISKQHGKLRLRNDSKF